VNHQVGLRGKVRGEKEVTTIEKAKQGWGKNPSREGGWTSASVGGRRDCVVAPHPFRGIGTMRKKYWNEERRRKLKGRIVDQGGDSPPPPSLNAQGF